VLKDQQEFKVLKGFKAFKVLPDLHLLDLKV
jgi:hypothetical protein